MLFHLLHYYNNSYTAARSINLRGVVDAILFVRYARRLSTALKSKFGAHYSERRELRKHEKWCSMGKTKTKKSIFFLSILLTSTSGNSWSKCGCLWWLTLLFLHSNICCAVLLLVALILISLIEITLIAEIVSTAIASIIASTSEVLLRVSIIIIVVIISRSTAIVVREISACIGKMESGRF